MLLVSCKCAALNLIVIEPLGVSEPPQWNMCDIFGKDDSAPYVTNLFCYVIFPRSKSYSKRGFFKDIAFNRDSSTHMNIF